MCGIAGLIDFKNEENINENNLRLMMKKIKHRGPDDEGIYKDKNIALGHVRLSILDLSKAGHQPMFCNDKRYVITFNGEIYNYIELKQELKNIGYVFYSMTDTEVILAAYKEWGKDCLNKFRGMFAFAMECQNSCKPIASAQSCCPFAKRHTGMFALHNPVVPKPCDLSWSCAPLLSAACVGSFIAFKAHRSSINRQALVV